MFRKVLANMSSCWTTLVVSDILFKAVTMLLLTPIVSLLFRLFLYASGREVLADADIARFLLHPLGVFAFVIVGGAILCIFALEQAVLMTICLAAERKTAVAPRTVLLFVAVKAGQLLRLTSRVVARLGIIAIPFLAVGAGIFWLMLTDHDINFYLTHKPPKFWVACSLIGLLLLVMASWMLHKLSGWVLASQLVLYEGLAPAEAMVESHRRSVGHRLAIARMLLIWAAINSAIGFVLTVITVKLGEALVSVSEFSLWALMFSVGLVMLLTSIANLAASMLANASCASLLGLMYARVSNNDGRGLPENPMAQRLRLLPELTPARILAISAVALLMTVTMGATAIHSFELEDHVQITAHRGGAGVAPENTLAAMRQAIEDGTDWIEIDVQESSDGVVIVAHDSDLAKVAGNPVKIWAATAEELRTIDIGSYFDERFKGERVPTLEEVLQLCIGKVRVNIELKYYGHTQDLENRVIELVERFGMESEIVVMSLELKGIQKVKAQRPDWKVGLLTAVSAGDLTRARSDFLAVSSKLATRSFVQSSHRREKSVSAWTVNDAYSMSAMMSRGVDNLITDYPALARQVLAERQAMSPLERLMVELAFYLGAQPKTAEQ